jgi:hypothetical protein
MVNIRNFDLWWCNGISMNEHFLRPLSSILIYFVVFSKNVVMYVAREGQSILSRVHFVPLSCRAAGYRRRSHGWLFSSMSYNLQHVHVFAKGLTGVHYDRFHSACGTWF